MVNEIFKKRGWIKEVSPSSLISDWDLFVNLCEIGFNFGLDEYENDVRVREWIELIISDTNLCNFKELNTFLEMVEVIDNRLKNIFIPNVLLSGRRYWWEQGVLSFAGEKYARDLKNRYNILVKVED